MPVIEKDGDLFTSTALHWVWASVLALIVSLSLFYPDIHIEVWTYNV